MDATSPIRAHYTEFDILAAVERIEDHYQRLGDDITVWIDKAVEVNNLSPSQRDEIVNLLYDRVRCKHDDQEKKQ